MHKYANVRGGSRCDATSKMEHFVIIVKALHLGCCSSPRSAFERKHGDNENNLSTDTKVKIQKFVRTKSIMVDPK